MRLAEDYVRASRFEDEEPTVVPGPNPAREKNPFFIVGVDGIEIDSDPVWLADGLLPAEGFGIVQGARKCGKSFILADLLFHVSMAHVGMAGQWAGRNVLGGAVVYVTAEGVRGFKRRAVALRETYGVAGRQVPFGVIPVAPDLGHDKGDHVLLIQAIKAWLASVGNPPLRAIAIDTLARTMKGADENQAKDMTTFVDNCDRLGSAFGCLVVAVHHTGKDASRGGRGSNALEGAADVIWTVEKGEVQNTVTIAAMKDGEDGVTWTFRLNQYALHRPAKEGGATSAELTTCTVEILSTPGQVQQAQQDRNNRKLGDSPRLLFSIVREAAGEAGEHVKGSLIVPPDVQALKRDTLKKYLKTRGYWDSERSESVNRATLSRDLKTLKARHFVGLTDEHVWLL